MSEKRISFTAVGDVIIQREIPKNYKGLNEISSYINQGDMRYFNLESTVHHCEGWANQYCGGGYVVAEPKYLNDLKSIGFNMLSFANNHTMDFDHWGLLRTIEELEKADIPHAGAGKDLDDAAKPVYIDTINGRIALIAASSTLPELPALAGRQSRHLIGRPGLNGLRHHEIYRITKEELEVIKKIAEKTYINGLEDIHRSEGFSPDIPQNQFKLGNITFEEGETEQKISVVDEVDMARIERAISEAKYQADIVVVAIHSHEVKDNVKEHPDDFLVEFAHRSIDAGANAIIGTGPHVLRPIEVYKNSPIFYSIGNFIFENTTYTKWPEEFFEGCGLTSDATLYEFSKARSKNFTIGLGTNPRVYESVVPYCVFKGGKIEKIQLLPVELGFKNKEDKQMFGLPVPAYHAEFIHRLIELSGPYGTKIVETKDGLAEIVI